ncbi:hypothetical protein Vretimale_19462 [Volvox reticuliferus]|uniref:Uncharacterized protein n=1 Tax=Volvox reticuliferus TaxID=1737510 RepID=A0A8J4CZ78_9CHLO|nr:hypothetical protein Vretifemale_20161 [Volvox reticuliferus]GIM16889.1 hypothetical protein Vretimale_19462 [Volvox reticuliferus]
MALQHQQSSAIRTVGLAFLPKKLPRVLTPKMRDLAVAAGLWLVALEPHLPLHEQQAAPPGSGQQSGTSTESAACLSNGATGPTFDIILHKLHADPVWEAHLEQYVASHPGVRVLDSPNAIHNTEDRTAMLAAIPPTGLLLRLPEPSPGTQQDPISDLHPSWGQESQSGSVAGVALSDPRKRHYQEVRMRTTAVRDSSAASPAGSGGCSAGHGSRLLSVRRPMQVVVPSRKALHALATRDGGMRPTGLRPPFILKTQRADAGGVNGHGLAVALTWNELIQKGEALQATASAAGTDASVAVSASAAFGGGRGSGNGNDASVVRNSNGDGVSDGEGDHGGGWEPLIIQQYVPHEEALYKVYVLGRYVRVERRASLTLQQLGALQIPHPLPAPAANQTECDRQQQQPDADPDYPGHAASATVAAAAAQLLQNLSSQPQPQPPLKPQQRHAAHGESHSAADREGGLEADGSSDSGRAAAASGSTACLDVSVLEVVARELSLRMGLTMFNFDVVVPVPELPELSVAGETSEPARKTEEVGDPGTRGEMGNDDVDADDGVGDDACVIYVVDVNYFPGYDKLPGWEAHMVAHLRAVADGLATGS